MFYSVGSEFKKSVVKLEVPTTYGHPQCSPEDFWTERWLIIIRIFMSTYELEFTHKTERDYDMWPSTGKQTLTTITQIPNGWASHDKWLGYSFIWVCPYFKWLSKSFAWVGLFFKGVSKSFTQEDQVFERLQIIYIEMVAWDWLWNCRTDIDFVLVGKGNRKYLRDVKVIPGEL